MNSSVMWTFLRSSGNLRKAPIKSKLGPRLLIQRNHSNSEKSTNNELGSGDSFKGRHVIPKVDLTSGQQRLIEESSKVLGNDFSLQNCLTEEAFKFLQKCSSVVSNIDHPFCGKVAQNFKDVIEDNDFSIRLPSILSLLYVKSKGCTKKVNDYEAQDIWKCQNAVAECAVMGRAGYMLHKDVQTFKAAPSTHEVKKLVECNKQIALGGDLLFSLSSQFICSLGNCTVLDLYATVISNYSVEEFHWGHEGSGDQKLTYIQGKDQWEVRNDLYYANSVKNFAASGLVLADFDENEVTKAKEFGKYAGYTIQAYENIKSFEKFDAKQGHLLDLLSLPAAIHLKNNPDIIYYFFSCGNKRELLDNNIMWKAINDSGSLEYSVATFKTYKKKALNLIRQLPENESRQLLDDLISSYEC